MFIKDYKLNCTQILPKKSSLSLLETKIHSPLRTACNDCGDVFVGDGDVGCCSVGYGGGSADGVYGGATLKLENFKVVIW